MSDGCACGQTFRTAEDFRDHLPCEPKPRAKVMIYSDGVYFSIGHQTFGPIEDSFLDGYTPEARAELDHHRNFIAEQLRIALGRVTEVDE